MTGGLVFVDSQEFAGDVESAAGVGIAVFISVTAGGFLGIRLWFLIMRAFRGWTFSLIRRSELLEQRISLLSGRLVPDDSPEQSPEAGFSAVKIYVASSLMGIALLTAEFLLAVIETGVGIHGPVAYAPGLCAGFSLALLGIAGQSLELMLVSRSLTGLEQRLHAVEGTVAAPAAVLPRRMDDAIRTAQSWVCRITGVCQGRVEPVAS